MKKLDIRFMILMGITGVIIIGGLYQWIFSPMLTSYYLKKESRYAITSSIGFLSHGGRFGSYTRDYHFFIEGKIYMGQFNSVYLKGQHYFVKFYPPNPRYNKITYIEASEKDIDSMPPKGYKTLPHQ